MKAIHNYLDGVRCFVDVVSNMSKILNESNSQLGLKSFISKRCCFQYVKDTK